MQKNTQRQEQNRAGVRKWYGENREVYNALRRERYAADPEARTKARERAARYREASPVVERELFREVNGKQVRVYSTGQVAQAMDRTPQMLRNWEKAAMIPPSSFPDKHRLYTAKQLAMVVKLAEVIWENSGSWSSPKVKAKVRDIHKRW